MHVTLDKSVIEQALEVLEGLEFSCEYQHGPKVIRHCPECGGDRTAGGVGPVGHREDCSLALSMAGLRKVVA